MPTQASSRSTERLDKPVEDTIGGYRVLGLVGKGGMATVWRVKGPRNAVRALKEMHPQPDAQREMQRRFKQEFDVARLIEHRNVVRVHDFFAAQDTLHIVMEWVDGLDLRTALGHAGLLDDGRLAKLGAEIAAGLGAAHAKGVLHRDLKPENVLLSKRGQVKVTDFGVARVMGTRLTATGIIVGSPAYMSPEQLAGVSGQELTAASDVYALGVTLYEMGEGKDPLGLKKRQDLLTVLRAKRERRPRAPSQLQDPRLIELLEACLEPEESDRPQSMEEVARELRRIARTDGVKREDLEHYAQTALARKGAKVRARREVAPRPGEPDPLLAPAGLEPEPPRRSRSGLRDGAWVPPRQPRVPQRSVRAAVSLGTSSSTSASVVTVADPAPALRPRRPPAPPRPQAEPIEDFGGSDRHPSRIDELSVKRGGRPREPLGFLAWATILLFAAVVVFLGASTSLTGSPLGLVERLVPVP